jgi:hypothetical protein
MIFATSNLSANKMNAMLKTEQNANLVSEGVVEVGPVEQLLNVVAGLQRLQHSTNKTHA